MVTMPYILGSFWLCDFAYIDINFWVLFNFTHLSDAKMLLHDPNPITAIF